MDDDSSYMEDNQIFKDESRASEAPTEEIKKKFTVAEDIDHISFISMDPVTGPERKGKTYWREIVEHFHVSLSDEDYVCSRGADIMLRTFSENTLKAIHQQQLNRCIDSAIDFTMEEYVKISTEINKLNCLSNSLVIATELADQDAWNATNITLGSYDQANEECSDTDTNTDPVDPNATENTAEDEREEEPLNAGISESISISDNDITIRLSLAVFSKGIYGHKLKGSKTISYSALTKSIARRFDRRATKHPDLVLYIDRKNLLIKMGSNINTILRKRSNTAGDGAPFTVKDVANEDYVTRLLNRDQAFKTFSGVRSSSKYWKNQKK
ncbi:hypothetical protein MFLAVUS_005030 [Mucor flavus]|uniref:Uncharacterized protein n=1 Tax=Mucor flavus TaxID=439312 RepID=A0ABP9YXJ5_9FUNG